MEVTSFQRSRSNQVNHDSGTYTLSAEPRLPPLQSGSGMGVTYGGVNSPKSPACSIWATCTTTPISRVAERHVPSINTYAVANNTLTVSNAFVISGACGRELDRDNIVHMRADYGWMTASTTVRSPTTLSPQRRRHGRSLHSATPNCRRSSDPHRVVARSALRRNRPPAPVRLAYDDCASDMVRQYRGHPVVRPVCRPQLAVLPLPGFKPRAAAQLDLEIELT